MPRQEVLINAALLLVAGHETTVNLITNGTLTLLRHPEVLDRLRRGDADLAARVVEGPALRTASPGPDHQPQHPRRHRGRRHHLPEAYRVTLVLAAGSRDPAIFPDPDRFDPDREHNEHLGFGGGIHYCFGAPLARPETQIALTELARRWRTRDWSTTRRPTAPVPPCEAPATSSSTSTGSAPHGD